MLLLQGLAITGQAFVFCASIATMLTPKQVRAQTFDWIERWVIGEGLCPFARAPWEREAVRIRVVESEILDDLVAALHDELLKLHDSQSQVLETTVVVAPNMLADFEDFLDFLEVAQAVLRAESLQEDFQVVSFHPDYRFADCPQEDRANATNRSPFPSLQLLRQDSVNAVLHGHPDPSAIYERNIAHLRGMSPQRWAMLQRKNEEEHETKNQ